MTSQSMEAIPHASQACTHTLEDYCVESVALTRATYSCDDWWPSLEQFAAPLLAHRVRRVGICAHAAHATVVLSPTALTLQAPLPSGTLWFTHPPAGKS